MVKIIIVIVIVLVIVAILAYFYFRSPKKYREIDVNIIEMTPINIPNHEIVEEKKDVSVENEFKQFIENDYEKNNGSIEDFDYEQNDEDLF